MKLISNKPSIPFHLKLIDLIARGASRSAQSTNGLANSKHIFSVAGELFEVAPFRLDHVDNYYTMREFCCKVDFIVAEDNEATITITFSKDMSIGPIESTSIG